MVSRPIYSSHHAASAHDGRQLEMAPWAAYTPTWTNSTSNPTVGNATLTGRYRRHGTTLHWQARIVVGSTTSPGVGDIRLSLPSGMTVGPGPQQIGDGYWYDASTGVLTPALTILDPGASYGYVWIGTGTTAGNANGLANGDNVAFGASFEIDA